MALSYDKEYFQDYKEQKFKWRFWARYIRKYTKKEDNILELGCTYGFLFRYLKDYKNKYGIDISEHAIKEAKIRNQNVNYTVMDAEKLKFRENLFKLVIAIDVLEHLKNPEQGIKEIQRVLQKNGICIITTPNPDSPSRKRRGKDWFAYKDPTHIAILPKKEWRRLLEKNNFKIKKIRTIDLFDFPYCNKCFKLLNLLSYKSSSPFLNNWGDNTVIIAKKK